MMPVAYIPLIYEPEDRITYNSYFNHEFFIYYFIPGKQTYIQII